MRDENRDQMIDKGQKENYKWFTVSWKGRRGCTKGSRWTQMKKYKREIRLRDQIKPEPMNTEYLKLKTGNLKITS